MRFKAISYLELWQPLRSAERNHLCNFGRRQHEEQFCEIILNLDQWFMRCPLKIFRIWSSGSPFVKWSRAICAILVEGIMRNNSVKLFWILDQWFRSRCVLNIFLIIMRNQWFMKRCPLNIFLIWSSGGPFVQQSGTICAMLVEGIMRNNSVKLFRIWASCSGGDVV